MPTIWLRCTKKVFYSLVEFPGMPVYALILRYTFIFWAIGMTIWNRLGKTYELYVYASNRDISVTSTILLGIRLTWTIFGLEEEYRSLIGILERFYKFRETSYIIVQQILECLQNLHKSNWYHRVKDRNICASLKHWKLLPMKFINVWVI